METGEQDLTFLFSDIESSTRLWEESPEDMQTGLSAHDDIVQTAIESHAGRVVKTTGDGVMAVFTGAVDAVSAASSIQTDLAEHNWGALGEIKVRVALHTGQAQARGSDFFGPVVNRTARLMAAGHGGQTLLSAATRARLGDAMPGELKLVDLGIHRLKDLAEPEHVFQLQWEGSAADFPPLVTLDIAPNNLPTLTSSFLGRVSEQEAIGELLDNGSTRLITLVGAGGTGKTRLAMQIGADQIDHFRNGVFFIDLSTETDADESFANVARLLNIDSAADETALAAITRGLGNQSMLLLLDNLEQIEAVGLGINQILEVCRDVSVLATSRAPLQVRGEQLFPIEPLTLPAGDTTGPTADQVVSSEAGQLFEERARQTTPSFELDDALAPTVASIIRRLDGLPLGIELAAARLRMFSVPELETRLASQLDILKSGAHDTPLRQRTLHNTIEWSYDLLERSEQGLLELLSIFASASLVDLEEVANLVELSDATFDDLESLVDKSLVRRLDSAEGHSRFSLLETIRSFALERLEQDRDFAETCRGAHAEYFSDLGEQLAEQLGSAQGSIARERLSGEIENLQLAWEYWRERSRLDRLHQLLDPMWILYDAEGWYQGVITLAEDLLDALDDEPESEERTREQIALRTSLARARMLIRGYTEEAESAFLEALAQAEEAGTTPQRFPVLRSLASLYTQRGDLEKATEVGEQLLEIAKAEDDPALAIDAHLVYGVNSSLSSGIESGLAHVDQAVEAFDPSEMRGARFRLGPHSGIISLTSSAFLLTFQGFPDQARAKAARALEDADTLGHPYSKAYALFHVSIVSLLYEDLETASECASQLLAVANQYDYQIWRALAMVVLGVVEAFTGDPVKAMTGVEEGIEIYQRLPTPPIFWGPLLLLRAPVAAMAGNVDVALSMMDEAIGLDSAEPSGQIVDMWITRGDILSMVGRHDEAATDFKAAIEWASSRGFRTAELRALTRLVEAGNDGYRDQLRAVYDSFTEGFDVPDLVRAQQLLDPNPS